MEAFRCPRASGRASHFHSTTSSRPRATGCGHAWSMHSGAEGRVEVGGALGVGGALPQAPPLPPEYSIFDVPRHSVSRILAVHHSPALPCGAQVGALSGALSRGCWKDRIQ